MRSTTQAASLDVVPLTSNTGESSEISMILGDPRLPSMLATVIISLDSRPAGSGVVTPGAAEASMIFMLKLTYCAAVSFQTRSVASPTTFSIPLSNVSNMG